MQYKILWLDDAFLPIIPNSNDDENERREIFQSDVKLATDYNIDVVGVSNYDSFLEKLKDSGQYQAVIFDLRGLDPDDSLNDYVMPEALEKVKDIPNILVYVYSANKNADKFDIPLRAIRQKGNCFSKASGVELLYEKIISDLNTDLQYYKGREECLMLFNKSFLDPDNRIKMDNIFRYENEVDHIPYNDMRQILEDMLNQLVKIGDIKIREKEDADTYNRFNKRMEYITKSCDYKRDSSGNIIKGTNDKFVIDFNKPLFPFEMCSREIKYVLSFLCDITNKYSHFLEINPKYLRKDETNMEYNTLIKKSVYIAFYISMKWYYGYMSNKFVYISK